MTPARAVRVVLVPEQSHARYEEIFAEVEAPFAFVDLDAMWANAAAMLERAQGKPVRVASKSVRCRALLAAILGRDERFRGLMTFTLPETLWLAERGFENLLLAYPTADTGALGELALRSVANPEGAPIVMVDCAEHLDAIESVLGAGRGAGAGLHRHRRRLVGAGRTDEGGAEAFPRAQRGGRGGAGAGDREATADPARRADGIRGTDRRGRRSAAGAAAAGRGDPLHAAALGGGAGGAAGGDRRRGGRDRRVGDRQRRRHGKPGADRRRGRGDRGDGGIGLLRPRPLRSLQPLQPDPGGGVRAADRAQAERRAWRRRLGGGYLASGSGDPSRLPVPWLPEGLRLDPEEGAGEVQTPLLGAAARELRSAIASTCATPRRASYASASTPCTWSRTARSSKRSRHIPAATARRLFSKDPGLGRRTRC